MKVESPVGEVEMRACDHQAVLPIFMGVTKKVPQYNFLISADILALPGKEVMPTCERSRSYAVDYNFPKREGSKSVWFHLLKPGKFTEEVV
jgi:hypothetical protein